MPHEGPPRGAVLFGAASGRSWIAPRGHRDELSRRSIRRQAGSLAERLAVRAWTPISMPRYRWHGKGPKAGSLSVVVAEHGDLKRARPLLEGGVGQPQSPTSARWAAGQVQAKAVNQVLVGPGSYAAVAEAMAPGQRLGCRWRRSVSPRRGRRGLLGPGRNRGLRHAGGVVPAGFQACAATAKDPAHRSAAAGRPPGWILPIGERGAAIGNALIEAARDESVSALIRWFKEVRRGLVSHPTRTRFRWC